MYCRHCGNKIDEDSKFCSACGAPVEVQRSDSSAGQKQGGASDNPFAENFSADAPGRQYTPPPQQNYPPPYPPRRSRAPIPTTDLLSVGVCSGFSSRSRA